MMLSLGLGILCVLVMNCSGVGGFAFHNRMSMGVAPGALNVWSSTRGSAIGSHMSSCRSHCDGRLSGFKGYKAIVKDFM